MYQKYNLLSFSASTPPVAMVTVSVCFALILYRLVIVNFICY